ncbi:MAG TPA: methyltransferase domain-containing protein, partial [Ilumatobacteraceae bacterium]
GQHNPADIPTLHRAFTARKADIVVGSRWTRGGSAPGTSPLRGLGSRFGNCLFRVVTGTRGVRDATTSFRVYSPRVVRFLLSTDSKRYSGYSFFSTTIALAEAAGYSITEVPIEFRPRYSGQSKLDRKEVWRYFSTLGSLRAERRSQAGDGHEAPYRATDEIELLSMAKGWNRFVVRNALEGVVAEDVRCIVEVGAGLGGVTTVLAERFPSASILAIEPDEVNFAALSEMFAADDRMSCAPGTLDDHHDVVKELRPDILLYVNVLEHIDDDVGEMRRAADVLPAGAVLGIFVPALSRLYGPIDAKSGHFRRYSRQSLQEVVEGAGFDVEHIGYVDRLGIVPYWWNYRFLNKAGISGGSVWAFDRIFVPTMRMTEGILSVLPVGKNLACVARRRPVPTGAHGGAPPIETA